MRYVFLLVCVGVSHAWNQGPFGIRSGVSFSWPCTGGGFVNQIMLQDDGTRIHGLWMYCTDGSSGSYQGWGGQNTLKDQYLPVGAVAMYLTWDDSSICGMSITPADSTNIIKYGQDCSNKQHVSCNVGEKITGLFGVHASGVDAVFQIGVMCGPAACWGSELSGDYCSCLTPNTYQSNANCFDCIVYESTNCGVGWYLSGCGGTHTGTCQACSLGGANTYYVSTGQLTNGCGTAPCTSCPVGKQMSGCDRTHAGVCGACGAGTPDGNYFISGCSIVACPKGTYSVGAASTACTPCGSHSDAPSGSSVCTCNDGYSGNPCSACPAGYTCGGGYQTPCPTGQYGVGGVCTDCVAGYYSSGLAASACTACPAGTFSLEFAASCSYCGPATYSLDGAPSCLQCKAGTYSSASNTSACAYCAVGTYSLVGALTCSACGKGLYSTMVGASSPNLCNACDPGSYGALTGASSCALCPPGTATNLFGTMAACGPCLPNTFTTKNGSVTCTACSTPVCGIGNALIPCTAKTDASCSTCPELFLCTYTGNRCTNPDGSPACSCPRGYQILANACQLCPTGQFKALNNSASCVPWTVTSCPANTYLVNGNAFQDSACIPCPALPNNAINAGSGCSWQCRAGFDNSVV